MSGGPDRQPGSSSLRREGYWWHRARTDLLAAVMAPHLATPGRTLDVGSADAPSVGWMRGAHQHVSLDLFPDGLWAADVWYSVKRHWALELQRLVRSRRAVLAGG